MSPFLLSLSFLWQEWWWWIGCFPYTTNDLWPLECFQYQFSMHYMLTFKPWMKKLREARKMSQPDLYILPTEYIPIYKILSDHPNWQVLPGSDWSVFAYVQVTGKVKVWGMGYLMAVFLIRITPKDSSALTRMDVLPCLPYCTHMALHPHPPFPKS